VPTALALGSGLFAAAPATAVDVTNQAQNSLFGSSDVTDYLETDGVPQRTPIRTDEHPSIQGLPSGVSVERVEWITERRIALFIRSAAMPKELIQVQVLLARDWHSNPSAKYPEVWALDGLRAHQHWARTLLADRATLADEARLSDAIAAYARNCAAKRLSAGGSADLLALTAWLGQHFTPNPGPLL